LTTGETNTIIADPTGGTCSAEFTPYPFYL